MSKSRSIDGCGSSALIKKKKKVGAVRIDDEVTTQLPKKARSDRWHHGLDTEVCDLFVRRDDFHFDDDGFSCAVQELAGHFVLPYRVTVLMAG